VTERIAQSAKACFGITLGHFGSAMQATASDTALLALNLWCIKDYHRLNNVMLSTLVIQAKERCFVRNTEARLLICPQCRVYFARASE
jgi:hypothetical protein